MGLCTSIRGVHPPLTANTSISLGTRALRRPSYMCTATAQFGAVQHEELRLFSVRDQPSPSGCHGESVSSLLHSNPVVTLTE